MLRREYSESTRSLPWLLMPWVVMSISHQQEQHWLCTWWPIKWKYFPRCWSFVRSPMNSPHKGQWRGTLMFSLICTWIHGWINNHEAGELRCHRTDYDVTVMKMHSPISSIVSVFNNLHQYNDENSFSLFFTFPIKISTHVGLNVMITPDYVSHYPLLKCWSLNIEFYISC